MNKNELVNKIAEQAGIPRSAAAKALEAFTQSISQALAAGEQVSLVGFGTFSVTERAARAARNPRTGEPIELKAGKSPKFKPGKAFKDALGG